MKKLSLLFAFAFTCLGHTNAPVNQVIISKRESPPKTVKLKITGMTCAGCSSHITKALQDINGVIENDIEYPGDVAVVTFDPQKIDAEAIIKVIENTGYKATLTNIKKKIPMKNHETTTGTDLRFLTDFLLWGDRKIIVLLKKLNEEEFNRSFGDLAGSIHAKTAHILSIYEFFIKIFEGDPHDKFPDLSHLAQKELISKWETILDQWSELVAQTGESDLFALPPAGGQRVESRHIFLDALLHTVHHRGQMLTFIRLLGKTKEEIGPNDTNLDYLKFLFTQHKELVYPALR